MSVSFLVTPAADVAFHWGSISIKRVFLPVAAKLAARFTAVVVFPTPPFWFAMARVLFISYF